MRFTIKKIGHSCIVYERDGVRIMIDPGVYTTAQVEEEGLSAILCTHRHPDHCDPNSIKAILGKNPKATVVGNQETVDHLGSQGIACRPIGDREEITLSGVTIRGYESEHASVHSIFGNCSNTGYFMDRILFHTGDALDSVPEGVSVLAHPFMGGWMSLRDVFACFEKKRPKNFIPIHDKILAQWWIDEKVAKMSEGAKLYGTEYVALKDGDIHSFEV